MSYVWEWRDKLNGGSSNVHLFSLSLSHSLSLSLSLSDSPSLSLPLSWGIAHHSMPSFTCCSSPLPCTCYTSVSSFPPCSSNPLPSGYMSHTWRGRGEPALVGSHATPLPSLGLISLTELQSWRKEKSACIIKSHLMKLRTMITLPHYFFYYI